MADVNLHRQDRITRSAITSILSNTTLTAASTTVTTSTFNSLGYSKALVYMFIDSCGTPTTVQLVPQFTSDTAGSTGAYHDYREGVWASMVFEDTVTAAGIRRAHTLNLDGRRGRFNIVGDGITSSNTFVIGMSVELHD